MRGSLAGRLAHLFMTEVISRCELGIDLHSGSDGRANLPQIRADLDDAVTREAALAFAAPVEPALAYPRRLAARGCDAGTG